MEILVILLVQFSAYLTEGGRNMEASLKIGRRNFVVVPQRDFERMRRENQRYREVVAEDRALGKLAEKELKAFRRGGGKGIPWEHVKKELGL